VLVVYVTFAVQETQDNSSQDTCVIPECELMSISQPRIIMNTFDTDFQEYTNSLSILLCLFGWLVCSLSFERLYSLIKFELNASCLVGKKDECL
jgi:hypothetical protein